ncbi:2OG-Fe(II) oxygenase [Variovorax paradoxus]|nr:2OG-Fe(II) oxygenase [Variovorax paradoxus]MBT2304129.1 2OG-Fe(II) oxygenase [Variovorax paradoxus]
MASIANDLAMVLSTARTPGEYYATGACAIPLPRLEVNGVGPIALPLLPTQAGQLIGVAERAPYGRGEETLVDTEVRRTWQISAERVLIEGHNWTRTLSAIVARAAAGLGVTDAVVPALYKLLVYDQGSFFVGHRDTEKAPGMFATLIIALPSVHTGGELVIRHKGREVLLDLRCQDPSEAAFAAFYADCVHEVLPVTSGCRLALVYNLLRKGRGRLPEPPSYDTEQARLAALLQRWAASKQSPNDTSPEKLVYPLEHAYTPAELSFLALKGPDAAAAAVLTAAAQRSGCDLHVALLTIHESGSAEYTGYSGSRWRGRADEEDEEEFEIGEVCDRSPTLSNWGRPDGSQAAFGVFPFDNAELCPSDALDDMEPDEQYFQEATGNEGASFERTYRRAALVLWPQQRRLAVFNQAGLAVTLPYLSELTRRWAQSGEDHESPLWREAHELSGHMLSTWPRVIRHFQQAEQSERASLLALLARLKDTARIEAFLVDIIAAGIYGRSDNEALLRALLLLPAVRAGEWIERIIAANVAISLGACADLLARSARLAVLEGLLADAGIALVQALPGNPKQIIRPENAWQRESVDVGTVADLVTALYRIDANLAERAVDHMLAWPDTYGLDDLILPAIRRLTESKEIHKHVAVERLRTACLEHLRARVAQALEPPSDWARAAVLGCRCRRCNELRQFLLNAGQKTWIFKAAEFDRSHVLTSVQRDGCDVDCVTDRRGRPYSLVCTKNQASYDKRAKQRKQDLEDMSRLA